MFGKLAEQMGPVTGGHISSGIINAPYGQEVLLTSNEVAFLVLIDKHRLGISAVIHFHKSNVNNIISSWGGSAWATSDTEGSFCVYYRAGEGIFIKNNRSTTTSEISCWIMGM